MKMIRKISTRKKNSSWEVLLTIMAGYTAAYVVNEVCRMSCRAIRGEQQVARAEHWITLFGPHCGLLSTGILPSASRLKLAVRVRAYKLLVELRERRPCLSARDSDCNLSARKKAGGDIRFPKHTVLAPTSGTLPMSLFGAGSTS